ncbi:MAG: hypothetical protein JRJ29_01845 [Deltaproteobacteria bacterium]|nr:hypothetical protein [Deltaproteobacteria bacterium]
MAGGPQTEQEREILILKKDRGKIRPLRRVEPAREEIVKLNIDLECSRDFIEKLLERYTLTIRSSTNKENLLEISYSPDKKVSLQAVTEVEPPARDKHRMVCEPETKIKRRRRINRAILCALLLALVSQGVIVGKMYLERRERLISNRRTRVTRFEDTRRYRAMLVRNREALVAKLDRLTSIPRMREAFPEITSMPFIVLAKRASDPAEQAQAAIEYIGRVRYLFEGWVKRSHDYPPELRPTREDISYFLSLWEETKSILDSLENPPTHSPAQIGHDT